MQLKSSDISGGLDTFASMLSGKHHFSAEEKLFSYQHASGPVPAGARKIFLQGLQQHFDHNDKSALNSFDQAIKAAPKYLPIYIEKAALLADLKQTKQALSVCDQMLAMDWKYVPALQLKACCYAELKDSDKSIDEWSKAIAVNPRDAVAYAQRATEYETSGKKEEARRDKEEAQKLYLPQKVGLMMADGRSSEAIDEIRQAVKKYPDDFELRMTELTVLMAQNQFSEAEQVCSETAKNFPQANAVMHCFQAKCNSSLSRYGKAASNLSEALAEVQHPPAFKGVYGPMQQHLFERVQKTVLLERAEVYRKAKQFDKALVDASAYILLHPDYGSGYDERASINETSGDKKKALEDYKRASERDQHDARAKEGIDRLQSDSAGNKTSRAKVK
jgi:tetratricopeptide (TPR) repeat protein